MKNEILEKIKNNVEFWAKSLALFLGVCFALGFLIWNIYLQKFGFTPDNLFESRFILTGFVFIISYLLFLGFLSFVRLLNIANLWACILIGILWLFLFSLIAFPFIPSFLGGAPPRVLSVLGTRESIEYLNQFGIPTGLGSTIQTANLCVIYEDSEYFTVLLPDRVLSLKKEDFKGFGSLANDKIIKKQTSDCTAVAASI